VSVYETRSGSFSVSTARERLDLSVVHGFLSGSYWARGIPEEAVRRAVLNSLCFGLYDWDRQIGFARAISDYATFAYLADVFVLERYRGQGLGLFLMRSIMEHPDLRGLRRLLLVTRDAHGLYERVGFRSLSNPTRHMEIVEVDPYPAG
jgi:GNAT superfamily N-acetyltransferase